MGFSDNPWADTWPVKEMVSAQNSPKTLSQHIGDCHGAGDKSQRQETKDKREGKRNKEKGYDFCPWETRTASE